MRARRTVPFLLALALLDPAPAAAAGDAEAMTGLFVRLPAGTDWVVLRRGEGAELVLGRRHKHPHHSSIVQVNVARVAADVPPMTPDDVRRMVQSREGERAAEWLEFDARPDSFATQALRYRGVWLDRKVPDGRKRPHRVAIDGLVFRHPDVGLLYEASFSERAPEGVAHEDQEASRRFLAGLALHRPSAIPARHAVLPPATLSYLQSGRSLWVGRDRESENPRLVRDELARLDPESFEVLARVEVGDDPSDLVAGGGKVWVLNHLDGTVMRVDSARMAVEATVACAKSVSRLALTPAHVWVSEWSGPGLWRIPRDGAAAERVKLKGLARPGALCFDGRLLWIADVRNALLHAIDPATLAPVGSPVGVGDVPQTVVAGAGALWVLSRGLGAVQKVDVEARRAVATHRLEGKDPRSMVLRGGILHVADFVAGTIERLDVAAGKWIDPPLDVGFGVSCGGGDGALWVNDWPAHRLGRLEVSVAP